MSVPNETVRITDDPEDALLNQLRFSFKYESRDAIFEFFSDNNKEIIVSVYVDYGSTKNIFSSAKIEKDRESILSYLQTSYTSVTKDILLYGNTCFTCNNLSKKNISSIIKKISNDTQEEFAEDAIPLHSEDKLFEDKLLIVTYKDKKVNYKIQYCTNVDMEHAKLFLLCYLQNNLFLNNVRIPGENSGSLML